MARLCNSSIAVVLLLAAAPASADDDAYWLGTADGTVAAHVADGVTTAAGLALGAAEANPLGLIGLAGKVALYRYAESLPPAERTVVHSASQSVTWGVVANNTCVLASLIASAGIATPACVAVGAVTSAAYWKMTEDVRRAPRSTACYEPWSALADEFPDFVCKSEDS